MPKRCKWLQADRLSFRAALHSALLAGGMLAGSGFPRTTKAAPDKTPSVQDAAVCIDRSAVSNINACPSGKAKGKVPAKGGVPPTRVKATEPKKPKSKEGPTRPGIELDLATRLNREKVKIRAWALLQREVKVLNRLVRNTPSNDPRQADVLARLAETYFELQVLVNARVRSYDEPIFAARSKGDKPKAATLQRKQRSAEKELEKVRKATIRTYARLAKDHPDYDRLDEVLFSLAFALTEMRQFDQARKVYLRLIKSYPDSRYIPNAYLSFAEYYFNDGDMTAALTFYKKVLDYPPKDNPVYGFALYKSAWAEFNLEKFKASLTSFVRVLEFAQKYPRAHDAKNLAAQSRKEMVVPYSRVGRPDRALPFFRKYSKSDSDAIEMLELLAEIYYDTGQWGKSVASYHKLIAERSTSDRVCYWQGRVTSASITSQTKREQVIEVQRMVDIYDRMKKKGVRDKRAWQQCQQETASTLVWLATTWHRETVGTKNKPGTKDSKTMALAARLYQLILEKFSDLDSMKFPNIDRRDWPTTYRISYYYAELLWKMEDWQTCGPAFDHVVKLNPEGEFTSDAAYAAVLCYNNLYEQRYVGREKKTRGFSQAAGKKTSSAEEVDLSPREFTPAERGMLDAFQRYVCFVPNSSELPTVKYRRARIFYEANHFEEAAVMFRDVAWNHRKSPLAVYAANLYLDSLNALGSRKGKENPACIEQISSSLEPLWGMYCSSPKGYEANGELCGVVEQLRCDVLRKQAEIYEKREEWKNAAKTYITIVKKYRQCGRLDEVLYNAALDFEAASLVGRAVQVRRVLVQKFPESPLAKRSIYLLGANFHALAYYEQAAAYYERFAELYPGELGAKCTQEEKDKDLCPVSNKALKNAVFFRLGLGQGDKAQEDVSLFERNYRRRFPRETAQVHFSLGSIYKRKKEWARVVKHYLEFLKRYGRLAMPQQVVQANREIAVALWALEKRDKAQKYLKAGLGSWQRGGASAVQKLPASAEEKARYDLEGREAASEILFLLAESRFEDFQKIRFPKYSGGRSLARVNKWAQSDFRKWVGKKGSAVRAAEKEYNQVAELKVPQWEIAAASRIGEMYRSFVDEFRDAPVPKEIERDAELYDAYVGALDQQSEPFQRQAIDKFEFCLITATRVRWFNRWSRQCERELNRLNPRDYPVAAEIRARPNREFRTAGVPGAAKLTGKAEESLDSAIFEADKS